MKKYLSFFRIRFSNTLQYRAAAYGGIATQFAWGFMRILMFRAFYEADPAAFPMEFSQLTSYIWLQQAFLAMFATWFTDGEIFSSIQNGNIAYELLRPMNLYSMWFTKNLALRLSRTVLRCMPILVITVFLPKPYGLSMPINSFAFLMFFVTMILAFFCVVAFMMLLYISAFYTLSPAGVRLIALSLAEFLEGGIIPLPFLPDTVRRIVELTPFASMGNVPYRVYSGDIAGNEILSAISLQIFWIVALVFIGKVWIEKALKKVVVQGG